MISTKNINKNKMGLTPEQRKTKVAKLREEHEDYFQTEGKINALYIPKMAYRPSGKDELHISFFPSELEKSEDVYTEFVSIDYESEDPKRTLYLHKYNPHWRDEYELTESKSGYQRHLIPVSELIVIRDITEKKESKEILDFANLPNPDDKKDLTVVDAILQVNETLNNINKTMYHILNKMN